MTKDVTNIDRIIAKIDNDFNPDNSDWIPRVGAWVHDGLGLLSVSTTKRVKEKFIVKDRIAYNKCEFKGKIKVFDCNGCEIKEYTGVSNGCCTSPFTGEQINSEVQTIAKNSSQTSGIIENPNAEDVPDKVIDYPGKENDYVSKRVVELWEGNRPINFEKNYVLIDCKNIELNFDTDCIIVEYDKIKECHSNIYNCDFPEIPNNAKVIEFLAYWCIYKMLLRGYKHPVMNLHASQYGTNPYYIAQSLMEEAKRSVAIKGFNEDLTPLWRSSFFISTFDPRH